jgi:hypothetical protein
VLSSEECSRLEALGPDLATVWTAPTTTPRDRKELLGTLIEEVIIKVQRDKSAAHLTGAVRPTVSVGPYTLLLTLLTSAAAIFCRCSHQKK